MYLNNMLSLPVNSSPGWVFPRQNFEGRTDLMHKYLARIMSGIHEFKKTLERYAMRRYSRCLSIVIIYKLSTIQKLD